MFRLFKNKREVDPDFNNEITMEETANIVEEMIIRQGSNVLKDKLEVIMKNSKDVPRANPRQLNYPDDYIAIYLMSEMMTRPMIYLPEIDFDALVKKNVQRIKEKLL
jgi:hypothetical protein